MSLLRKLFGGGEQSAARLQVTASDRPPDWMQNGMEAYLCDGREDLEVVGESHYQDNLWRLVGGRALPEARVEWTLSPCWRPRPTTHTTPTR